MWAIDLSLNLHNRHMNGLDHHWERKLARPRALSATKLIFFPVHVAAMPVLVS
jgi:hypothetical protein